MCANSDCSLSPRDLLADESLAKDHSARVRKPRTSRLNISCGLLLLAISASVAAETHFCIAGDVDHLNAAEVAACQSKMIGVREAVRQHGAPADWHFVVVCDEAGWKEYASFGSDSPGSLADAGYNTDPRLRWTFLRGSELNAGQPQTIASTLSMALKSVPYRQQTPQPAPSARTRTYGIATAKPGVSHGTTQARGHV